MDPRQLATLLAAGRIALGAALFAAPGTAGRLWLGESAATPGGQVALRGLGARDVALGVGALAALSSGGSADRWLEAGVVADAADATAVVLARKEIGFATALGTALVAGGAAIAGLWLRGALDDASGDLVT